MKKLKELGFIEILTDDTNERAWLSIKGRLIRGDKTFIVYRTLGTTVYRVHVSVGSKTTEHHFLNEDTLIGFLSSELSDEIFYITTGLLVLALVAAVIALVIVHKP